eukprot:NODE_149_length_15530_cov_0.274448.p1 type:complete len:151 gc:universal NODE_149_length_15530_cov_0.274448:8694-8242(-)
MQCAKYKNIQIIKIAKVKNIVSKCFTPKPPRKMHLLPNPNQNRPNQPKNLYPHHLNSPDQFKHAMEITLEKQLLPTPVVIHIASSFQHEFTWENNTMQINLPFFPDTRAFSTKDDCEQMIANQNNLYMPTHTVPYKVLVILLVLRMVLSC